MDIGRLTNRSQPVTLVGAQVALWLWAAYDLVRSLPWFADTFSGWVVVLGVMRVLAAWAIANEAKIGWWLGLLTCAASSWPIWEELSETPSNIARLDLLVLVAFPVTVAALLLTPASRTYERVWFR